MQKTGVYIELKDGSVKKTSYEALTLARASGDPLTAFVVADDAGRHAAELKGWGISELVAITGLPAAYEPEAYAAALAAALKQHGPTTFVAGYTAQAGDLVARTAARLGCMLVNDCLDVDVKEGVATKPLYAGKAIAKIKLTGDVRMFTVRPNVVKPAKAEGAPDYTVAPFAAPAEQLKLKIKEVVRSVAAKIDLTEAEIIVSGGRGVKSKENFALLEDLAKVLNAAVGASRGAVDAGFAHQGQQVGQTGKTVNPKLYIACGISGAIQHLAGMKTAKVVVAVNSNPDAPIFKKCDYGIVGDLFEVIPLLKAELAKVIKS